MVHHTEQDSQLCQWKTAARLCQDTGMKSLHLLDNLVEEVMNGLPGLFRRALGTESAEDHPLLFPELSICGGAAGSGRGQNYQTSPKHQKRACVL